jgi:hypothetical protein
MSAEFGLQIHYFDSERSKKINFPEKPNYAVQRPSISPSNTRIAFFLMPEFFTATWTANVGALVNRVSEMP